MARTSARVEMECRAGSLLIGSLEGVLEKVVPELRPDVMVRSRREEQLQREHRVFLKLLQRDAVLTFFPEVGRSELPRTFSAQRALVPAACPSVYCSGRWLGHKKCVQPACLCPLLLGLG